MIVNEIEQKINNIYIINNNQNNKNQNNKNQNEHKKFWNETFIF